MREIKSIRRQGGKVECLESLKSVINGLASNDKYNCFVDLTTGGYKAICGINIHSFKSGVIANDIDMGAYSLGLILKNKDLIREVIYIIDNLVNKHKNNPKYLFEKAYNTIKEKTEERLSQKEGEEKSILKDENFKMLAAYHVIHSYSHYRNNSKTFDIKEFDYNFFERKVQNELYSFNSIMKEVTMLNENLFEFLKEYRNNPRWLIYIDPPYHPDAMSGKEHYNSNFTKEDHRRLCELISDPECKCNIILSGWQTNDYKEWLLKKGFRSYIIGVIEVEGRPEMEIIWTNNPIPSYLLPDQEKLVRKFKEREMEVDNKNIPNVVTAIEEIAKEIIQRK